jgi:hypothetical protein
MMVKKRGKQFFDCFARGVMVNTVVYGPISLCRMLFFAWAREIDLGSIIRRNWTAFQDYRKGRKHQETIMQPARDIPNSETFSFSSFPSPVRYVVLFQNLIPHLSTHQKVAPKFQAGCIE